MWLFLQSITLYFLTTLLGLLFLILLYYKHAFTYWKRKNVPFLEPSFPFGNMRSNFSKYIGQQIGEIYHKMRQEGHSYCGYYLFGAPVFMPLSLELIKQLLITDFWCFSDRGFHLDEKNDPMGASIVTFSGEKWKMWRERLSPMFTAQKTKIMLPIVKKCTKELGLVLQDFAKNGKAVPIQEIIKRYTVDVICCSAFGVECNCLKDPESEFFKHAKMIFTTKIKDNLRLAIGMSVPIISKTFKIQLFNPKASEFFRRVVKEAIEFRETQNIERPDFLNLLLRLKHDMSIEAEHQEKFQENGKKIITDDEIAAQCFLFYIAGFETTSCALSFSLYELAANPDIQTKLRQEIAKELIKNDGKLNYEVLGSMQYLDCVFKETMRKHPTVHMLNRIASRDFQIPGTQTIIKKGTKAMLSTMGLHHDPEYFPNPGVFDPERFSDENRDRIPPLAYLPFGDGPRICPGMRFGIMEFKICLAEILTKYVFSLHSGMKDAPKICSIGNVLGTEQPILLKVEEI